MLELLYFRCAVGFTAAVLGEANLSGQELRGAQRTEDCGARCTKMCS